MRRFLFLLAAIAALPAGALTCAPLDPLQSLVRAQAAPETYAALHGHLTFDAGAMPDFDPATPGGDAMPPLPVAARFEGVRLGRSGFTEPLSSAVTLRPTCAGSWCGGLTPGTYLLLARDDGSYSVELGPCGGWAFADPTPDLLDAVAACVLGGECPAP